MWSMIFIKHQCQMFHSGVKNVIHISKASWCTVSCVTQRHITVDVTKSQVTPVSWIPPCTDVKTTRWRVQKSHRNAQWCSQYKTKTSTSKATFLSALWVFWASHWGFPTVIVSCEVSHDRMATPIQPYSNVNLYHILTRVLFIIFFSTILSRKHKSPI